MNAAHGGGELASMNTSKNSVEGCCVCEKSGEMMRCGDCKSARYCSKYCRQQHFPYHVKYYSDITDLEYIERQKLYKKHLVRQEQIDVKTRNKLVKLIGEKPVVKCILDGVHCEVLWDTGSMITLVDAKWVKKYFP